MAEQQTDYIVLRLVDSQADGYELVQRVAARDAENAIRKVALASAFRDTAETYVATPARSWNPVKVTPRVETTLILEEAN